MDIKYFVRTTKDSKVNYDLDYTEICDTKNQYIQSYIDALNLISNYDAVLLEDDCVLCKNFKEEIEKVINEHPNDIINFFSFPNDYMTSHYSANFNYNQCTYFPKELSKKIIPELQLTYDKINYSKSYGALLNKVLRRIGIIHYIYRPTLVQHIDPRCKIRNTLYFKDYLDKLNISIEEAYKLENQSKLLELLNEDRKKWHGIIDGIID